MMELQRERGFYEKYTKRLLDIICSLLAIIFFSWLYLIIAVAVRVRMGKPILFKQPRPGMVGADGKERIFEMYKFRTMTDKKGADGNLLPDEERMPAFGRMLRATSLDELPEVFNILKGDMSMVGPRPQLVRDMVFMDARTRMRHTAKPGLSGMAQVMGRNAITWEEKFEWDLKYIEQVNFWNDLRILMLTVKKVFGRGCTDTKETDVSPDYGDALLESGRIGRDEYDALRTKAGHLVEVWEGGNRNSCH